MLTRDVWNLSEEDFPNTASIDLQLRFLLRYAILAPSVKNTQPWSFTVAANQVYLFAALERDLPVTDPHRRELYVSLGCALENLLVAAEHFGFRHEVSYFPEPENDRLVATVSFAAGGTPTQAREGITLDALVTRRNDNSVYRSRSVSEGRRRLLEACQLEPELHLDLVDDRLFRRWIEAFTVEADRREFADPEFREELGHWIGQGVLGTPGPVARLAGLVVSRLDLGESVARQDHDIVQSASLLGLISATSDTHLEHVRTGQLFERLWLTATAMGINIHPMSQTMRHPELRAAVAELLPATGWIPQHLFRVGYSAKEQQGHTPRRPLGEVVEGPELRGER
jgi:nitroreductase